MNDVAFEWSIPYVLGKKQKCFKVLLIAETIVFLFNGLFLVRGLLVVSAALAVISFLMIQSGKENRRELYQVSVSEVESFFKGRQSAGSRRVRDYTSNRPGVSVFTLNTKNDAIYLEPNEAFLNEMHYRRLLNEK